MKETLHKVKKALRLIKSGMSYTQIIALGYFLMVLAGALLLMLPFAARSGERTDFLTALFTATTSTCVTGLVVADTATHWSLFGQLVILLLIQVGGMGFITMGVVFAMLLKKKITLSVRELVQESMNANQVGGMVRLVRQVFLGTMLIEGAGALLLSIRFIPQFGVKKGIYYSIFHAISAFCNAGIDLMGTVSGPYSSLTDYAADPLVSLVICALIIIGGIGFFVWGDVRKHKLHWKKYALHTKLALSMTFLLLFGGTLLFYLLEQKNTLEHMNMGEGMLAAFFDAVTARTAGFNTTDTAALSSSSKLLTILLMLIGGSPGSAAGGIKTVTVMVLAVYVWSNLRSEKGCNVFGRRLLDDDIKKASNVLIISLMLAMTAALVRSAIETLPMEDIMFEVFSAIGTVGMTTGITRSLSTASRLILILLMYCGRIGSMSFALSFTERKGVAPIQLPSEKVMIG